MSGRALSFGGVAGSYERFRPGYPQEVVALVTAYAGRPVRTALEIGAGTGKATRLFAEQSVAVTASDPDPAMLTQLRQRLPQVATVQAAFEELQLGERFDLVYAAAALHWTRPEGRWRRMAALLHPGGVFANLGGPVHLADPSVAQAVLEARAPYLANDEIPPPDGTHPEGHLQWPGTELERSGYFTDVRQTVIERRFTWSADEYLGNLSTVSAYVQLPPKVRERVLLDIMAVLPETVRIAADVTVHLARRLVPMEEPPAAPPL